jgi:hypothetical protein
MADMFFPDHHDFDEYFMSPMFLRGFSPQYRHLHLDPLEPFEPLEPINYEFQVFYFELQVFN